MKLSYEVTLHCEGEGCEEYEYCGSESDAIRAERIVVAIIREQGWLTTVDKKLIARAYCPECRKTIEGGASGEAKTN